MPTLATAKQSGASKRSPRPTRFWRSRAPSAVRPLRADRGSSGLRRSVRRHLRGLLWPEPIRWGSRGPPGGPPAGSDIEVIVDVSFEQAVLGGESAIDLKLPTACTVAKPPAPSQEPRPRPAPPARGAGRSSESASRFWARWCRRARAPPAWGSAKRSRIHARPAVARAGSPNPRASRSRSRPGSTMAPGCASRAGEPPGREAGVAATCTCCCGSRPRSLPTRGRRSHRRAVDPDDPSHTGGSARLRDARWLEELVIPRGTRTGEEFRLRGAGCRDSTVAGVATSLCGPSSTLPRTSRRRGRAASATRRLGAARTSLRPTKAGSSAFAARSLDLGPDGDGGPHVFVASLEALELAEPTAPTSSARLRVRPGDPLTASDGAGLAAVPVRAALEPTAMFEFVLRPPAAHDRLRPDQGSEAGARCTKAHRARASTASCRSWPNAQFRGGPTTKPQAARATAADRARGSDAESASVDAHIAPLGSFAISPSSVRADRGGERIGPTHTTVLIGPEGGGRRAERSACRASTWAPCLRAETAAIAAGALIASYDTKNCADRHRHDSRVTGANSQPMASDVRGAIHPNTTLSHCGASVITYRGAVA